jgi:hypothetical protein
MSRLRSDIVARARFLCGYISDVSTVRVRLIEQYGIDTPLPSRATLATYREDHLKLVRRSDGVRLEKKAQK